MAMTSAQRKALDRTLEFLAEDLDVTPAIIHLKSKDILQDIDEEKISAKTTDQEKVMEFVKIIKKRGMTAFDVFKEYLENYRGSQHLAKEIEKNLKTVETELAGLTLQSDGRKQIEKWKALEEKFQYVACQHESIGLYQNVPDKVNVLLIGKTGSGKSATGNTIIGETYFKASGSSESVTKTIDMKVVEEDRFTITVIDTPGLFDTAKDFLNEDTLLEIAKTMISFKGGIHLFLIVCSSTRFTAEEQQTIAAIEKILSKNVYKNCVILLTYAQAQFGPKGKNSLREHIDKEVRRGGKFAEVIQQVKKRVLAVENYFDEDFLKEKHRQSFLCFLAQVIQENEGSVYSNKTLEYAKERVEKQDEQRKQRLQREAELTIMRSQLRKFLVQKYLNNLTVKQLDNIRGHCKTDIHSIMKNSFVDNLLCIRKDDVKEYLKEFIKENEILIEKLKDMKIQEERLKNEYQNQQEELKEKENVNKMHHIVLTFVHNYLRQLSKDTLEELLKRRALPDEIMSELQERLSSLNIEMGKERIRNYIRTTVFLDPTEISRYMGTQILEDRIEQTANEFKLLERSHSIHKALEMLKRKVPEALDGKPDDELHELNTDLKNIEKGDTTKWEQLFDELIGNYCTNIEITLKEISNLYLSQNASLLESIMSTILEKRQKQMEARAKQEREVLRNTALGKISEVIQENLKSYLALKSASELQKLDKDVSKEVVPEDVFNKVGEELTQAQKQSLTKAEIKEEIINQIKSQNELIEKCKEEAKWCFSGLSKVITKERGMCEISKVKIDDEILVFDQKGDCFFDKVYLISHARAEDYIRFICLKTFCGKELFISPCHLIPVGNLYTNVAAKDLVIGNVIFTMQSGIITSDYITSISYELCRGAYCPMTMNGTIVVNDVAASCYTNFVPYRVAHVLLSPIRALFSYVPLPFFDMLLPYDAEEGMPVLLLKCRTIVAALRSLVGTFNVRY